MQMRYPPSRKWIGGAAFVQAFLDLAIYIYIYMCVCVCVCVCQGQFFRAMTRGRVFPCKRCHGQRRGSSGSGLPVPAKLAHSPLTRIQWHMADSIATDSRISKVFDGFFSFVTLSPYVALFVYLLTRIWQAELLRDARLIDGQVFD